VADAGPQFDPRLSAWSRLGSLEPNLHAFVTQDIDPSVEEPLDLEAFADGILAVSLAQTRVITRKGWEEIAATTCFQAAVAWRMGRGLAQNAEAVSRTGDQAEQEADVVTRRLFRFADSRWDVESSSAVDRVGRPVSGQAVTPSEGAALAPELAELRPSADRPPDDGPYETRASHTLQLDTFTHVTMQVGFLSAQRQMPGCEGAYVASIVPMDASAWSDEWLPADLLVAGTWFERWTLDCGGTRLPFAVAFMPDPNGGTNLMADLIE
jgi:hypothetical protein